MSTKVLWGQRVGGSVVSRDSDEGGAAQQRQQLRGEHRELQDKSKDKARD